MATYSAGSATLDIVPDLRGFENSLRTQLRSANVDFGVDIFPDMTGFTSELDAQLGRISAGIDIAVSPDMTGFVSEVRAEIARLTGENISLDVELDFTTARAQLAAFRATNRSIEMNVDVDITGALAQIAALQAAAGGLDVTANAASSAASSVAGMVNPAQLATFALAGLAAVSLIPLVASATQALGVIALLPAAGAAATAGLATVIIGSGGIIDAFSAMGEVSKQTGTDIEDAARRQEDALFAVADAQDRVVDSQKNESDAVQRAKDAQRSLTDARIDAKDAIDNMNLSLKNGELSEEAAVLSYRRAQQRLAEARANPRATGLDLAEADLNVRQAAQNITDVRVRNEQNRNEATIVNAQGVEGAPGVVSAQQALADAQYGVQQSAEQTQKAIRDLARAEEDAARQTDSGTAAADKFAEALAKLSPNAREFVLALQDLGPQWGELRRVVQENLFAGLGESITTLANAQLPTLQDGLGGIATVLNENIRNAFAYLSRPEIVDTFRRIFDNITPAIDNIVKGVGNIFQGLLTIADVGSSFLPGLTGGVDGQGGFLGATQRWADRISEMAKSGELKEFIQGAIDKFNELAGIAGKIIELVGNLFSGSEETGDGMLQGISDTLGRWNEFLGSEDGQEKMRQFFADIRDTTNQILDLLRTAGDLLGTLTPLLPAVSAAVPKVDISKPYSGPQGIEGFGLGVADAIIPDSVKQSLDDYSQMFYTTFDEIKAGMPTVSDAFGDMHQRISDTVSALPTVFSTLRSEFKTIASSALENVGNRVGGVFSGLETGISQRIDSITGGGFTRLKEGFRGLVDFFSGLSGGLSSVWDGVVTVIKNAVGVIGRILQRIKPISIGPVKIGPDFQSLGNDLVMFSSSTGVATPAPTAAASGQKGMSGLKGNADGGVITGPGTGTSDSIVGIDEAGIPTTRVSAGEFVVNAASTARNLPLLNAINKLPGLASGGVAVGNAISYAQSKVGTPYVLGGLDCSMFASGVYQTLTGGDPESRAFDTTKFASDSSAAAMGFQPGLFGDFQVGVTPLPGASGHMAFTLAGQPGESGGSHGDVDFGAGSAAAGAGDPQFSVQYSLPGSMFAPPQTDADTAGTQYSVGTTGASPLEGGDYSPTGTYVGPYSGGSEYDTGAAAGPPPPMSVQDIGARAGTILADGLLSFFGLENSVLSSSNPYNRAAADVAAAQAAGQINPGKPMPLTSATAVTPSTANTSNAITVAPAIGTNADNPPSAHIYDPAGGAEQWRSTVARILTDTGRNVGDTDRTVSQINIESGGNPSAQNNDDINAQNGTPSIGLLQIIKPTFDSNMDPRYPGGQADPEPNIAAGFNYAENEYGSLASIWPKVNGYYTGGSVAGPGGIDNVPAWLTRDEFVVNAQSAAANRPLLEAINADAGWASSMGRTAMQGVRPSSSNSVTHDRSTNIGEVHLTDLQEFSAMQERKASLDAIGAMASLP